MSIKIRNGTPNFGGKDLCKSCRYSRIIKGELMHEDYKICTASYESPQRITFKVVECSHYIDTTKPSLYDMQKMAHIMVFKKGEGFIGFKPNNEFRKDSGLQESSDLTEGYDIPRFKNG